MVCDLQAIHHGPASFFVHGYWEHVPFSSCISSLCHQLVALVLVHICMVAVWHDCMKLSSGYWIAVFPVSNSDQGIDPINSYSLFTSNLTDLTRDVLQSFMTLHHTRVIFVIIHGMTHTMCYHNYPVQGLKVIILCVVSSINAFISDLPRSLATCVVQ